MTALDFGNFPTHNTVRPKGLQKVKNDEFLPQSPSGLSNALVLQKIQKNRILEEPAALKSILKRFAD
jgi:hypothetical protein